MSSGLAETNVHKTLLLRVRQCALSCVHIIFSVASNRVSVPVVDRDGSLNNMDAGPPQDLPINIQVNAQ